MITFHTYINFCETESQKSFLSYSIQEFWVNEAQYQYWTNQSSDDL